MTLSVFPGKILETGKIVFNFLYIASSNVVLKQTDHSRLHSISRVSLQTSPARFFFFFFRFTHKFKSSSHKKKIKNFFFLKNGSNYFHQIFWVYCTFEPQQYGSIGFSQKIFVTRKIFFNFLSVA